MRSGRGEKCFKSALFLYSQDGAFDFCHKIVIEFLFKGYGFDWFNQSFYVSIIA